MADNILSATALQLDASELRKLTKWPDPVIEEFLSLQRSVSSVVNNINIIINNTSSVTGDINLSLAKNTALAKELANMLNEQAAIAQLVSNESASRRDLERVINNLRQFVQPLNSLPAKVANMKRDIVRLINNLSALNASLLSQNNGLQAKVTMLEDQVSNMKQELAGML